MDEKLDERLVELYGKKCLLLELFAQLETVQADIKALTLELNARGIDSKYL